MKIINIFLILIGSIITLNGIFVATVSNFNMGIPATLALGLVLIGLGALGKRLKKWIKIALLSCVCLAVAASGFLLCLGYSDTADYEEDALIVLGAAVHGDTPSLVLHDRLDTAVFYHKKNPDALIVVSGGKGNGENITEAEAMERYLLDKGVPQELIIKEEFATSTLENFKFSKVLLDERSEDYKVAYITNEYHIFRAGLTAKKAGFDSATHINSTTRLNYLLPGVLRECMAVARVLIFGFR